jgi:hypothetical protein
MKRARLGRLAADVAAGLTYSPAPTGGPADRS